MEPRRGVGGGLVSYFLPVRIDKKKKMVFGQVGKKTVERRGRGSTKHRGLTKQLPGWVGTTYRETQKNVVHRKKKSKPATPAKIETMT